jgi:hypothetical protein
MKAKYPDAALDVILKLGAEASFKKPASTSTAAKKAPAADTAAKTPAK